MIENLKEAIDALAAEAREAKLSASGRKRLDNQVRDLMKRLSGLLSELDPIRAPTTVFDSSDPNVIGRFIAIALVAQPRAAMAKIQKTYGAGVYAIYYTGDFTEYSPISGTETPIYVGKATPKSRHATTPRDQGDKLSSRLREHCRSIERAKSTLNVEDFEYRSLVVQSGQEESAENYLIHLFNPIWNKESDLVFGVGKHGDDANTRGNKRSPWDTLHPGRPWAAETEEDKKSPDQIREQLQKHFTENPAFNTPTDVLKCFLDELKQL